MQHPISISGIRSVSALGNSIEEIWNSYLKGAPLFKKSRLGVSEDWISEISDTSEKALLELRQSQQAYTKLDRSVLLAMLSARQSFQSGKSDMRIGINFGSSRGATQLFESYHETFLNSGSVSAFTSPTTTLGNISSWVGQELGIDGYMSGHSVTCSTALHGVLNGIAWLQSGMADLFIAGGSEAALTPFTLAQMKAMKLYSTSENVMACESMRFQKKKNSMVLGEAGVAAVLEKNISEKTLAKIIGYGVASEKLKHNSSISDNADCFQRSMRGAMESAGLENVDIVIMHAPGTVKGDLAEKNALDLVFGNNLPLLTTNKWLIGHTFGASGMMSMEMAVLMLRKNTFIENPFYENSRHLPNELNTVLVNAVGFGGNAVSIIIRK
ncbi:beta-ketoacyl synthase [Aureitalea sp. L0-47]|uniref:beta-ketoacyl synthase N-terminal-like domain-containing protein n=1 Tax=Aureitalea sp. L0-47 TaxID=2816962 RepID=UPI002237F2BA|nr:beta-ketoacyl synthase N-terminal-like domain-containing protein [Aureitalea sp. L0-47]MCW5518383.1 beta-ketoacyl synthase [Aureitalea sp. L0-47]